MAAAPKGRRGLKIVDPHKIKIRHYRFLLRVRQTSLWISFLTLLAIPLWHLLYDNTQASGKAQPFLQHLLPMNVGDSPFLSGATTSLQFFYFDFVDPTLLVSPLFTLSKIVAVAWAGVWTTLLVVFLGRFFCGWLCPYSLLVSLSTRLRIWLLRRGFRLWDLHLSPFLGRWILYGLVVFSLITGFHATSLIYPPAAINREILRWFYFGTLGAGTFFLAAAFLFDVFMSRAGFCRFICPGGALFSLLGKFSPLQLKRSQVDCTECTLCDEVCDFAQQPMSDLAHESCDRCSRCLTVCPTQALRWDLQTKRTP